jgi:hypothetical protein
MVWTSNQWWLHSGQNLKVSIVNLEVQWNHVHGRWVWNFTIFDLIGIYCSSTQTFDVVNATFSYREGTTYEDVIKSPRLLPNGEFKIVARFFNDRDNNIATARFIVTLKVFTNEEPMWNDVNEEYGKLQLTTKAVLCHYIFIGILSKTQNIKVQSDLNLLFIHQNINLIVFTR